MIIAHAQTQLTSELEMVPKPSLSLLVENLIDEVLVGVVEMSQNWSSKRLKAPPQDENNLALDSLKPTPLKKKSLTPKTNRSDCEYNLPGRELDPSATLNFYILV